MPRRLLAALLTATALTGCGIGFTPPEEQSTTGSSPTTTATTGGSPGHWSCGDDEEEVPQQGNGGSYTVGTTGTWSSGGSYGTFGSSGGGSYAGATGGGPTGTIGPGGTAGGTTGGGAEGTTSSGSGHVPGTATASTTGSSGRSPFLADLTAGAWDDHENIGFMRDFLRDFGSTLPGELQLASSQRLRVKVQDAAGRPLGGAEVALLQGGAELAHTFTGGEGLADLFPGLEGHLGQNIEVRARLQGQEASARTTFVEGGLVLTLAVQAAPARAADVAFVLDATGSMDDEIRYLQAQVVEIANVLVQRHPDVDFRFGAVVYRDDGEGEDYVTRSFPLSSDPCAFRHWLKQQSAGGGGDYPEVPELGLEAGLQLGFRGGNVARLVFQVADAPHHTGRSAKWGAVLQQARTQGIHLYPVAASGADLSTEYELRLGAWLTGGRYLFLTDDSGIGGGHEEPRIPCYFVTTFGDALVRMVDIELEGQPIPPATSEVMRTGGDPQSGVCTLASGRRVVAL